MDTVSTTKQKKRQMLEHPLVVAVISAIAGAVAGAICTALFTGANVEKNYVPFDNLNTLFQTYFIKTGLIEDETFLELELTEQLEKISSIVAEKQEALNESQKNLNQYRTEVSNQIVVLGESKSTTVGKTDDWLMEVLAQKISKMNDENKTIPDLQTTIETLKNQPTVSLNNAKLVVNGETRNEEATNSVAQIDGHIFFSENVLNTFLDETISYDSSHQTMTYGKVQPEKVRFNWDELVSDASCIENYTAGSGKSFIMSKETFDSGLVNGEDYYSVLYLQLKQKYSKISFTVGHVDGSNMGGKTLYIYTTNENGEYTSEASYQVELNGEMPLKKLEFSLNYAQAIKIVMSETENRYARYGLGNIYLHS